MAASPGRSYSNNQRRDEEIKYIGRLQELPRERLLEILPFDTANLISSMADDNLDFPSKVTRDSEDIRYNTAIYDDQAEEFIFNGTVERNIKVLREPGTHESAENVRILRSARAVIYYTLLGGDKDGI